MKLNRKKVAFLTSFLLFWVMTGYYLIEFYLPMAKGMSLDIIKNLTDIPLFLVTLFLLTVTLAVPVGLIGTINYLVYSMISGEKV